MARGRGHRAGLWLTSTVEGLAADRFRVVAEYVGRDGGAMVALSERGVAVGGPRLARYIRRGLVEEYSVSVEGVQQDFVVAEPPGGAGPLRVELRVERAKVQTLAGAVGAPSAGSGDPAHGRRRLMEGDLHGTCRPRALTRRAAGAEQLRAEAGLQPAAGGDARDRELSARLEVVSDHRLAVVVEDAGAVYQVRIDPTFSDESWVSLGGLRGPPGWYVPSWWMHREISTLATISPWSQLLPPTALPNGPGARGRPWAQE